MENKQVGWLIVGIGIVMTIIVLIFNMALKKIVDNTCTEGPTCVMYDTIKTQTWISLSIIGIILIIGLVIMFQKPKERIVIKKVKEKKKELDLSSLDTEEKKLIDVLLGNNRAMFQADLMEKLGISKVKATRLLDKLESKQLIERKRRGMNNLVVLRD